MYKPDVTRRRMHRRPTPPLGFTGGCCKNPQAVPNSLATMSMATAWNEGGGRAAVPKKAER